MLQFSAQFQNVMEGNFTFKPLETFACSISVVSGCGVEIMAEQDQTGGGQAGKTPDPLEPFRRAAVRAVGLGALVTAFVNILALAVPAFNMSVYNTVIPTRNFNSLAWLAVFCIVGLTGYSVLEYLRASITFHLGFRVARELNVPTLRAAIGQSLQGHPAAAGQALNDLNELRAFTAGPAPMLPLDLAWVPLLVAVMFLLNTAYGLFTIACCAVMCLINVLNDLTTRRPLTRANKALGAVLGRIPALARNAEVIEAMGMLPAAGRRWN